MRLPVDVLPRGTSERTTKPGLITPEITLEHPGGGAVEVRCAGALNIRRPPGHPRQQVPLEKLQLAPPFRSLNRVALPAARLAPFDQIPHDRQLDREVVRRRAELFPDLDALAPQQLGNLGQCFPVESAGRGSV